MVKGFKKKLILLCACVIVVALIVEIFFGSSDEELPPVSEDYSEVPVVVEEEDVESAAPPVREDLLDKIIAESTGGEMPEDDGAWAAGENQELFEEKDFVDEDFEQQIKEDPEKEEEEPIEPVIALDPIEDYKFGLLLEAIFEDQSFDYPGYSPQFIKDTNKPRWKEWTQNYAKISGNIYNASLRFEHPDPTALSGDRLTSFAVDLTYDEPGIVVDRMAVFSDSRREEEKKVERGVSYAQIVKHSHPKQQRESLGLRITVMDMQGRRVFLEGRGGSGVVVLFPKVEVNGPRGALLCPRDYDLWQLKSGVTIMANTGFEMVGATFKAEGIAQGRVLTGFGPGISQSTIQVTPTVAQAQIVTDRSLTLYPYSSVEYQASRGFSLPLAQNRDVITAGLKGQVVMHNSYKHKSVSTGIFKLTVKKVNVPKDFAIPYREHQFRVKAGTCYAVIKEVDINHVFTKEPLPKGVQQNDGNKVDLDTLFKDGPGPADGFEQDFVDEDL